MDVRAGQSNLLLRQAGVPHTPSRAPAGAAATAADRWIARRLQEALGPSPVRIALWDASTAYDSPRAPVASIVVTGRRALWQLALRPELAFGECYTEGTILVDGDLVAGLEELYRAWRCRRALSLVERLTLARQQRNTIMRARHNIHHHYDIGNDFYRLWLDRDLVYTCAYFPSRGMSLEQAQIAKMDYVCRKLNLRPGERVVEAGCGWGALALHMARRYGVRVRAYNISSEQIRYARDRARAEGLADRVEFVADDYRAIQGTCDAFVSVGMLEHVGRPQYPELALVIDRCLDPARGRGLLHFIGRNRPRPLNAWIRKRIFPGAYPPTIEEAAVWVLQPGNFTILDVENLRPHYALTLGHWLDRFERSADQVRRMFGEPFVRAWRLYLAGSQAAFTTGWLQLFQVVFGRTGDNTGRWTREELHTFREIPEVPQVP